MGERVLEGSWVGVAAVVGNLSPHFCTASHNPQLKESSLKQLGKN